MRLSGITNLLVQVAVLHQSLSSAAVIRIHSRATRQIRNIYIKDQAILNMGSAWSGPGGNNGDKILQPVPMIKGDDKDPRYRRLTQLLKLNHHDHSIFYHNLEYHNHMAYILSSAYLFGASADHLNDIYEKESKELEPWKDSPQEIDPGNWRAHLGDKNYQRAYLHFFEEEMIKKGDNWKVTVWQFLTDKYVPDKNRPWENHQLLHGLMEGIGHPLIHLGYAMEMNDKNLAAEALAMAASSYQNIHEYVDDPNPPEPFITSTEIREILDKLFENPNYDEFCKNTGVGHPEKVLETDPPFLEFNTYIIKKERAKLAEAFQKQVEAAVMLLMTSHKVGDPRYDFFLAHTVTTIHALRVIIPMLEKELPEQEAFQQTWHLLRSHMVLTSVVYISQCRPTIKDWLLEEVDLDGKDWDYVKKKALEGERRFDSHYVKMLRSFEEFEKLFGKGDPSDEKHNLYLKAAVKFADEFKGWVGFAAPTAGMGKLDYKDVTHHQEHHEEHHDDEHHDEHHDDHEEHHDEHHDDEHDDEYHDDGDDDEHHEDEEHDPHDDEHV
ncbi:hypothetical protein H072_5223 [Dactylellina haptotyla CBS 200.50]|uniref:Uncharacterized protein n=1 Tax=Dactylellina haptotyla (strain CBS 200.50) TaxID=1284197 RepID=S8AD25_DACHA|nr:hypothetical protein H072_5223 [Dactylellina haptotyla CBS 200.50]